MLLIETNSTASVDLGGGRLSAGVQSANVGFACYVSPDGEATAGRLAGWRFGEGGMESVATIEAMLEADGPDGFQVVFSVDGATVQTNAVKLGEWDNFRCAVPPAALGCAVTVTYGATDSVACDSATFVALDDLALWYGDAASPTDGEDAFYDFNFTAEDLATLGTNGTIRTATDALGNVLYCRNCAVAGAGASGPFALNMTAENGVVPEIY